MTPNMKGNVIAFRCIVFPGSRRSRMTRRTVSCLALAVWCAVPQLAKAEIDIMDAYANGTSLQYLWPNWLKANVASYTVTMCSGCGATAENLRGLTVVNFAGIPRADNNDFKAVY